jgi:hypothetical protein
MGKEFVITISSISPVEFYYGYYKNIILLLFQQSPKNFLFFWLKF